MLSFVFQVTLYNTDQEGSDSPRSSLNNSLSDQSLASVNLNSVGSVHSYTPVRPRAILDHNSFNNIYKFHTTHKYNKTIPVIFDVWSCYYS